MFARLFAAEKLIIERTTWVQYYTGTVTALGIAGLFYVATNLPQSWSGPILFALTAAFVELTSVELYINSRSRVSVATIIAIASTVLFGPVGGALAHLTSGIMTAITTTLLERKADGRRKAPLWQRLAFNTSMLVTGAILAGVTYLTAGGNTAEVLRFGNIIPLTLAVVVDTFTNILLLMGVLLLQTGRSVGNLWEQEFSWGVPIALAGGIIGGGGLALGYATLGIGGLAIFMLPIVATGYAFRAYANNTRTHVNKLEVLNQQLDGMNQRLEQSNLELLQTLGAVIDAFDIYTYGHSTQVAVYGQTIAEEMGLSAEMQDRILRGGLVHDIGKIGIMDSIIGKPGRLTNEEYEALKQHTTIGAEIIGRMTGLQDLIPLVRNHHERWDGRGYPDRLKATETAIEARILAVADSVDAMLSDRPYQATRTVDEVVQEVIRCSGAQYDPDVVKAFVRVYEKQQGNFFLNSAARVDRTLARNGVMKPQNDLRYLKKSMLIKQLLGSTMPPATH